MSNGYLIEKDCEPDRFSLYKSTNGAWYCDFCCLSSANTKATLLIELSDEEQIAAVNDRNFLIGLGTEICANPDRYSSRALDEKKFVLVSRNQLLAQYSSSMGNHKDKFIELCKSFGILDYSALIAEFDAIQDVIYDHIWELTAPDRKLTGAEIEAICAQYCRENYSWIDAEGLRALISWLGWMCWHEGILQ